MLRRPIYVLMLLGLLLATALAVTPRALPAQETEVVNSDLVVVRAYFDDPVKAIQYSAERAVWEMNFDEKYLVIDANPDQLRELARWGFRTQIDTKLTTSIQRVSQPNPDQITGIPGYPCYRTVEETFDTAAAIAAAHPNLATWTDVGDSWEKANPGQGFPSPGYDMMVLRLTNFAIDPTNKPKLFITSAIHAREYTTAELDTRFAEYLVNNYGIDADATWLLDYHDIHLMLQTNPDGRKQAETGQLWRKNTNNNYCSNSTSRGADLNRNFVFQWGCCGGSSGSQCSETYRGATPGSEPETQAVMAYMSLIFPDQRGPNLGDPAPDDATGVYIDLHSYSQLVLWPWGFTNNQAPNGSALQTLGRRFAYFNNYLPEQSIGLYPTDGTTVDQVYGELGVAGYTFELGTNFFEACSVFENTIFPDNMPALIYAAKVARTPYLTPAGPDALNVAVSNGAVPPGTPVDLTGVIDDTRFNNSNGTEPTQIIIGAEYYVDTPPWEPGAVAVAMGPADGSFNTKTEGVIATVDTSGLSNGRHTFYVRGRDLSNSWGPISAVFLHVIDPLSAPTIQGYVTDADTGAPLAATVTAGQFSTTTNPGTGFFQMQVIAGTYDITASAQDHASQTVTGVTLVDYQVYAHDFALAPICAAFSDDVESGVNGWTATAPWAISTEMSHSPTHAWSDSPGGSYASNRNISLTSPVINLSGYSNVELNFWQVCNTEAGYDFCHVEISTNGGGNWSEVAQYDGAQSAWEEITIATPQLDNQANARIRFRFTSDGSVVADGWHVDDIKIRGTSNACGGGTPEAIIYTSPTNSGTVGGVTYDAGDILAYNEGTGNWSMFLNNATTGASGNLNSFDIVQSDKIVMSFDQGASMPGVFGLDDSDMVLYTVSSNKFRMLFDGSDVNLSSATEPLDAIAVSGGRAVLSTVGAFDVGTVTGSGEDMLRFINTRWGPRTSGSWQSLFDGAPAGLPNIKGAWAHCNGQDMYLLLDDYAGNGPGVYIYNLSGGTVNPTPFWTGADGYTVANVDGLHISLPECSGVQLDGLSTIDTP